MHDEDRAVEAVGVAFVDHEVVEVRLQSVRGPTLFRLPAVGVVLDDEAPRADAAGRGHRVDQDVAVSGDGRLDDRAAFPFVLPQQLAVGGIDAHRSGRTEDHDLRHAVDRDQVRRAVAAAVQRADPAQLAGGDVVPGERAIDADDHHVVDDERRARDAPERHFARGFGRGVVRPDHLAGAGVERIQHAGGAHRVDAILVNGRRAARTGAAVRFIEANRIA